MSLKDKKVGYWLENFSSIFVAGVIAYFVLQTAPTHQSWVKFIQQFPTLGMCAFGFLLTFLGIILQGKSETIDWIKGRVVLFKRLVGFNKRIIILSLVLSLYAFAIGYFNYDFLQSEEFTEIDVANLQTTLIVIFTFGLSWFLIDILIFIIIFYLIIQSK